MDSPPRVLLANPEIKWYQTPSTISITYTCPSYKIDHPVAVTVTRDEVEGALVFRAENISVPGTIYRSKLLLWDRESRDFSWKQDSTYRNRVTVILQKSVLKEWGRLEEYGRRTPLISLDHTKQLGEDEDLKREERIRSASMAMARNVRHLAKAASTAPTMDEMREAFDNSIRLEDE
jgi:hypothetical protein